MMKTRISAVFGTLLCMISIVCPTVALCQQVDMPGQTEAREGVYEITLKTPDSRTITVDRLVRDRDLNPNALYRVGTAGYMAFEEDEWVDKIEFKVFDVPVTRLPQYQRLARLMVEINGKIWNIKQMLRNYDELSFRLINICDKSRFEDLEAIDRNIALQLDVYRELMLLRALVVNSLNRIVRGRSCVDRYSQYQRDLKLYTKRLTDLCQDFDRLKESALMTATTAQNVSTRGARTAPPK